MSNVPAFRERESHTQHLKSIEAELDAQVARVENVARERARAEHEEEKRALQDKMECEMAKMDAELKIFKTVRKMRMVHSHCITNANTKLFLFSLTDC